MTQQKRQFCGRTRREFLWQTGAGFGGAALASLLSKDGFFDSTRASEFVNPARREAASLRTQSQIRHFSVHVWRTKPHRHLRL